MDELNELEGLTAIETNSRRGGNQEFDLYHDAENNEYVVADDFYAQAQMNLNGFTAHVGNGNIYLSVQPNDDSVSYKGREGFDKGVKFKSTNMSQVMSKVGLVGNLSLEFVGEKNERDFYRVSQVVNSETTQTIEEELAV